MGYTKKLLTAPGIVGACLLLILVSISWFVIGSEAARRKPRAKAVIMIPKKEFKHNHLFGIWPGDMPRKWMELTVTADKNQNEISFNRIVAEGRKMIAANDTIHGIHIQLSDESPYGAFVRILTICEVENFTGYLCDGNDFWIMPVMPPVKHTDHEGEPPPYL